MTTILVVAIIGPFVEGQEEWPQYADRVKHFFKANDIKGEEKKLAMFLMLIGPQTYKLLACVVAPMKPVGKKVVEELKNHYDPQPSEIMQRSMLEYESVVTYLAELNSLVHTSVLNEMLRDRLVCEINEDSIQKRLLSETKLTYHEQSVGHGSGHGKCQGNASLQKASDREWRTSTCDTVTKARTAFTKL